MPSMATGRFFPLRPASSIPSTNISNEVAFKLPTLDYDQTIVLTSPTINLIYRALFPCLIFIGTCGSIMSLKSLYAQRFRRNNSTYVFFFLIALVDLAILYTGALRLLILALTGFDVRSTSLFICRVHRFTTYFLLQLSSCLLALMTLDRARKTLSMLPPLKQTIVAFRTAPLVTSDRQTLFHTRFKESKILWITCVMILSLITLDLHFFYCTGYRPENNHNHINCQSIDDSGHCQRYWLTYLWLDAFLYSYLPFFIITISNVRLIIYLQQQRRRRLALTSSTTSLPHNHRITCSVILMSFLFLIFSVPVAFLEQFERKLNTYQYYYHCLAVAYLAMYFNHTISFFLFLFGTQFRQSVKELIWAQANEQPRTNTTLIALVPR